MEVSLTSQRDWSEGQVIRDTGHQQGHQVPPTSQIIGNKFPLIPPLPPTRSSGTDTVFKNKFSSRKIFYT